MTNHGSVCMSPKQNTVDLPNQAKSKENSLWEITSKQMVTCFTVPLEHRRTLNSEWYTTICLSKIFEEILRRKTAWHTVWMCMKNLETWQRSKLIIPHFSVIVWKKNTEKMFLADVKMRSRIIVSKHSILFEFIQQSSKETNE